MTKLIIARHGNTFGPNDTPTRVGGRTDLPLVESGREQAVRLGQYLKTHNLVPEITYSSELKRTVETAEITIKQTGFPQPVFPLNIFNEIDYGEDENQTEDKVIARIGEQAIKDWDERAIVPAGWKFDPQSCIENWKNFAKQIVGDCNNTTLAPSSRDLIAGSESALQDTVVKPRYDDHDNVVLVVTSNGIARFAPHLIQNFEAFAANHKIKLSTGALGVLEYVEGEWVIKHWNVKP